MNLIILTMAALVLIGNLIGYKTFFKKKEISFKDFHKLIQEGKKEVGNTAETTAVIVLFLIAAFFISFYAISAYYLHIFPFAVLFASISIAIWIIVFFTSWYAAITGGSIKKRWFYKVTHIMETVYVVFFIYQLLFI